MKKNLLIVMFVTIPFFSSTLSLPGQPPFNPGQMPDPNSPLEQKLAQVDWNQVNNEITNFVNTLPPEQQQQFYKDVNELTNTMSKMSEEELTNFMNTVITPDQVPMLPNKPAAPQVQPTTPEPSSVQEAKTEPQPVVIPQKPKKKVDETLATIKLIITLTERFLRTAHNIPELPGKVERWVEQRKVREWKQGLTWDELKKQIDLLVQKLKKLTMLDPKTNQYRHIAALIENESLYNNLMRLSSTLSHYEPKVKAPQFGLGNVSKDSRSAIKEVLSAFAEAIYLLDIPKSLDAVIAKYEPRAKELSANEDAARKLATEESKKSVATKPMQVAGKQQVYGIPKAGYGANSGGYNGSYMPPYSSNYNEPYYEKGKTSQPQAPEKGNEKPVGENSAPEIKRDKGADNRIKSLDRLLSEAGDICYQPAVMNALVGHGEKTDEIMNNLSLASGKLHHALDEFGALKIRLMRFPSSAKKMYEDEIKEVVLAHEESLQIMRQQKLQPELAKAAADILNEVNIEPRMVTKKGLPSKEASTKKEATTKGKEGMAQKLWYQGGTAKEPMTKKEHDTMVAAKETLTKLITDSGFNKETAEGLTKRVENARTFKDLDDIKKELLATKGRKEAPKGGPTIEEVTKADDKTKAAPAPYHVDEPE